MCWRGSNGAGAGTRRGSTGLCGRLWPTRGRRRGEALKPTPGLIQPPFDEADGPAQAELGRGTLEISGFPFRRRIMRSVTLSKKQREELLGTLKARFEKNMDRHQGLEWAKVQARL